MYLSDSRKRKVSKRWITSFNTKRQQQVGPLFARYPVHFFVVLLLIYPVISTSSCNWFNSISSQKVFLLLSPPSYTQTHMHLLVCAHERILTYALTKSKNRIKSIIHFLAGRLTLITRMDWNSCLRAHHLQLWRHAQVINLLDDDPANNSISTNYINRSTRLQNCAFRSMSRTFRISDVWIILLCWAGLGFSTLSNHLFFLVCELLPLVTKKLLI